mmetsp:Transcript_102942/g.266147  ORF Transcript_102942/g.266147 Transcript_102942/m.266147 type:complete len:416 (-) Transcript_102942:139-1386(-)
MQDARALLDSLFGTDRDATGDNIKRQSFKDDDVCKYYLVGDCPHEHFVNTEGKPATCSPIGGCKKQHSQAMRMRLKEDKEYKKYRRRYLELLQAELRRLVDENDRKRKAVQHKLKEGTNCTKDTAEAVSGHISAREMLVNEKMQAAEKMAEEGDMETSKKTMEEAEELAHEKYRLTRLKEVSEAWLDEVCEVCGCQISWRAIEELEARAKGRPHPHVPGAWHQGWARCRDALKLVDKQVEEIQADPESRDPDVDRKDRDRDRRDRDRDKDRRRSRSRDRERRRSRSRSWREKDRERQKERDTEKDKKEKEREKEKKDKEKEKEQKEREKEKAAKDKGKGKKRCSSSSEDERKRATKKNNGKKGKKDSSASKSGRSSDASSSAQKRKKKAKEEDKKKAKSSAKDRKRDRSRSRDRS